MKSIEIKTTESKVHAVTVFQTDRAEIVRLCTVDLEVRATWPYEIWRNLIFYNL